MKKTIAGVLRLASLLGSVAPAFTCTAPAYATTLIWLTVPNRIGPSTVAGHLGDIPLTSYSQNASNNLNASNGLAGRGVSVCGQVTITKLIDRTSPIFLRYVLMGNFVFPRMTISFEQQNATTTMTYYTVDLENVVPTSITQSDSTSDIITETIVLSAQRFRFSFFDAQNPDGSISPGTTGFSFNCTTPQ